MALHRIMKTLKENLTFTELVEASIFLGPSKNFDERDFYFSIARTYLEMPELNNYSDEPSAEEFENWLTAGIACWQICSADYWQKIHVHEKAKECWRKDLKKEYGIDNFDFLKDFVKKVWDRVEVYSKRAISDPIPNY